LFSSNARRFLFEQDRNREALEFLGNRIDQLGNAALSGVRY
jgi:hypothetical protein